MEAWRRPELGWASWKGQRVRLLTHQRQEVGNPAGSDVTLTCTLGRTAMTDTAMQNSRLRLMKTLCSTQSSGWV